MTKYYVAGPMSGIPQFNYPAFDWAAGYLRDKGYEVVSPAEMDDEDTRAAAMASTDGAFQSGTTNGETWGDFLARDVKLVADEVDSICLLPGWENSRGARLETYVALSVQKPVVELIEGVLCLTHPSDLMRRISKYTINQGDTSRYEG